MDLLYDTIMIMQNRLTKTVLYIGFLAMLTLAAYVIFISSHMITNKYYFYITAAAFVLACAVFFVLIIKRKMHEKKNIRLMVIICVLLVVFQVMTLPIVNLFSQTLPVWPPRGTIFQMPRFRNSISQNEVGLIMRYYLGGKTLYANEDYPLSSHNGFLFITDEYGFIKSDYPELTKAQAEEFYTNNPSAYQLVNVVEDPKLKIKAFKIYLYVGPDSDEMIMMTDVSGSWYFMTPGIYEEAFGERN